MALPALAALVVVVLALGYRFYGGLVARQYALDPAAATPAHRAPGRRRLRADPAVLPVRPALLGDRRRRPDRRPDPRLPAVRLAALHPLDRARRRSSSARSTTSRPWSPRCATTPLDRRGRQGPPRPRGLARDPGVHLARADLRHRRVRRRHRRHLRRRRQVSAAGRCRPRSTRAARSRWPPLLYLGARRRRWACVERFLKPPLWLLTVDLRAGDPGRRLARHAALDLDRPRLADVGADHPRLLLRRVADADLARCCSRAATSAASCSTARSPSA